MKDSYTDGEISNNEEEGNLNQSKDYEISYDDKFQSSERKDVFVKKVPIEIEVIG